LYYGINNTYISNVKKDETMYSINHVHVRSEHPEQSAEWYKKYFNAEILSSKEVIPGTITITLDTGGPVRLNISSQPKDSSPDTTPAILNKLGLEHFGFQTSDIESDINKFNKENIPVVMNVTSIPGGAKIAFIEGPDNVLIELVQPPS
jgi:predicted enzyme related to lactoylglutathione lyase